MLKGSQGKPRGQLLMDVETQEKLGTSSNSVPAKMSCLFSNKIAWSLTNPERLAAEKEDKSLTERNPLIDVENWRGEQTSS